MLSNLSQVLSNITLQRVVHVAGVLLFLGAILFSIGWLLDITPDYLRSVVVQALVIYTGLIGLLYILASYSAWDRSKPSQYFGLYAEPTKALRMLLGALPFIVVIGLYLAGSEIRLTENPDDKLMPSVDTMVQTVEKYAFTENRRTGEYTMLTDTISSLTRLGLGILASATIGFFLGVRLGLYKGFEATWLPIITFLSNVPPLALLPVLIVTFGSGEFGKFMLIFLGTLFLITRDVHIATKAIPTELKVKAVTLGASDRQMSLRIVMPLVFPRLLEAVRLSLAAGWLFLLAAEMISSSSGLGYQINKMTRYMNMSVIIPYVAWITILAYAFDQFLRFILWIGFGWYLKKK